MGDIGGIVGEGFSINVSETQKKLGKLHVHLGTVDGGEIKVGDDVTCMVNHARRSELRANHSATHLLHSALRRELGDHVTQKGSQVSGDRLRFDISHPMGVTPEQIADVELMVNGQVRANTMVETKLMTPEEAQENGAMALFGEKYGDEVRVVSMGDEPEQGAGGLDSGSFSVELCGGTHVKRTGDIGLLKVVSEGAVAYGVRRIEALTGAAAVEYMDGQEETLARAAEFLKAKPADVPERVSQLIEDRKKLEREVTELRKKLASGGGDGGSETKDIGGIAFAARLLSDIPAKELKGMADDIKKQIKSGVVALVAVSDGKASLVVGVTDDLTDKINAVELVRLGSEIVGGKGGGGRADMAQAGGPDGAHAGAALEAIEKAIGA